jgi:hypothetical protein
MYQDTRAKGPFVGLELEVAQAVAIGGFSPTIITPDWLVEQGVCKSGAAGSDFAYRPDRPEGDAFYADGFEWEVDFSRLCVSASGEGSDCGAKLARVLEILPHTPVEAIGHNFHFVCPVSEWKTDAVPMLGRRALKDFDRALQVRWDGRFEKPDGWVEVTLIHSDAALGDYVVVLFNHHHTVTGASTKDRAAAALVAATAFTRDAQQTKEMILQLFGRL